MSIKSEVLAEFSQLKQNLQLGSVNLARYMAEQQEKVFFAMEAGDDWQTVLKFSLINIRLKGAIEATIQADSADAVWWTVFWKTWSIAVTAMIAKIE